MPSPDFAQRQRQVRASVLCRVYALAHANVDEPVTVRDVLQYLDLTEVETDAALQFLTDADWLRFHFRWGQQKGIRLRLTREGIAEAERTLDAWGAGVLEPAPRRAPEPYPPYPALPDRATTSDWYVGSGWTRRGKQPGELVTDGDDTLRGAPHLIIPTRGLYSGVAVFGAVGSGKTEAILKPLLHHAITVHTPPQRHATFGGDWERSSWGMFVVDFRGDLTKHVRDVATAAGRGDDVVVIEPGARVAVDLFPPDLLPFVLAVRLVDGFRNSMAAEQRASLFPEYYTSVMSEFLASGIRMLRSNGEARLTAHTLLNLVSDTVYRNRMVAQLQDRISGRDGQGQAPERADRMALEFFRDFDDEDADGNVQRAVLGPLKAMLRLLCSDAVGGLLMCERDGAEQFPGFSACADEGRIVVLRCPPDESGPVAQIIARILLDDFARDMRFRLTRVGANTERSVLLLLDDAARCATPELTNFISLTRSLCVVPVLGFQSMAQLRQAAPPGLHHSITDNLRTLIALQPQNVAAAEDMSRLMGQRSGRGADPEMDVPWFTPEELMALRVGAAAISYYDGERQHPPRIVQAPLFFSTAADGL